MPRLGPAAARKLLSRIGDAAGLERVGTFSVAEASAVAALWDRGATSAELADRMGISTRWAKKLLRALAFLGVAARPRKRWRIDQDQVRLCYFCKRPMATSPYNRRGQPMPFAQADKLLVSYSRTQTRKHVCGGGPKLLKRPRLQRKAKVSGGNGLEGRKRSHALHCDESVTCSDRPGQKEGGGAVARGVNCREFPKNPIFPPGEEAVA